MLCGHRWSYCIWFSVIYFVPPAAIARDLIDPGARHGVHRASYVVSSLEALGAIRIETADDLDDAITRTRAT